MAVSKTGTETQVEPLRSYGERAKMSSGTRGHVGGTQNHPERVPTGHIRDNLSNKTNGLSNGL